MYGDALSPAHMTIVEELRQNRESGAKRLEAEYKAGLMTLARRFCSDESDAAELVNRTFAAVVDGIDDNLEQSAFFGWMCQILSNIHAKDNRNKSNGLVVYPGTVPDMADEAAEDAIFRDIGVLGVCPLSPLEVCPLSPSYPKRARRHPWGIRAIRARPFHPRGH